MGSCHPEKRSLRSKGSRHDSRRCAKEPGPEHRESVGVHPCQIAPLPTRDPRRDLEGRPRWQNGDGSFLHRKLTGRTGGITDGRGSKDDLLG